ILTFAFFFSSRRRHTRCYRDWSSDVCSSDLPNRPRGPLGPLRTPTAAQRLQHRERALFQPLRPARSEEREFHLVPAARDLRRGRSEERRVGKSVDLGGRRRTTRTKIYYTPLV